jgi:hypothetical protein
MYGWSYEKRGDRQLKDLHWNTKLHDAAITCSQDVSTNNKDDDASFCKIQLRKISPSSLLRILMTLEL